MMMPSGFTFNDHTTDDMPVDGAQAPVPMDWEDAGQVLGELAALSDIADRSLTDMLDDITERLFDDDPEGMLLLAVAIRRASDRALNRAVCGTIALGGYKPTWLADALHMKDDEAFDDRFPDITLLRDALHHAETSGEPATVDLGDGDHAEVSVDGDGTPLLSIDRNGVEL